jgi:hypothetical protein
VKDVLIEATEEKCAIAVDGTAQGETELLLLLMRLEVEEGMGGAERAVSNEIKIGSVELVGSDFVTTLITAPPARPNSAP